MTTINRTIKAEISRVNKIAISFFLSKIVEILFIVIKFQRITILIVSTSPFKEKFKKQSSLIPTRWLDMLRKPQRFDWIWRGNLAIPLAQHPLPSILFLLGRDNYQLLKGFLK